MAETTTKTRLLDTLAELERALETPLIPGEMERWTTSVEQALASLDRPLAEAIEREHAQVISQISQEDPGLLHVAAQLTEADNESLQAHRKLCQRVNLLSRSAEAVEPDEARLDDPVEQFIDAGLGFIIHVRKQEVALDTWLVESLNRDRGVVD